MPASTSAEKLSSAIFLSSCTTAMINYFKSLNARLILWYLAKLRLVKCCVPSQQQPYCAIIATTDEKTTPTITIECLLCPGRDTPHFAPIPALAAFVARLRQQ